MKKMFIFKSFQKMLFCVFLFGCLVLFTTGNIVPKKSKDLKLKINEEEPNGYKEASENSEVSTDCKCKNGYCTKDGNKTVCACYSGFNLIKPDECIDCECGKGINCSFHGGILIYKYCYCPDGNKLKDTPCKVTCKNLGNKVCGEMNRVCSDNSTEGYDCRECKEGYGEDEGTKKCVLATCDNKGTEECGSLKRTCHDNFNFYKCGECLDGFFWVENSNRCTEDLCRSSPCKNSGICKVVNDSFVCFCQNPFFGETCEQENVPTTMFPSTLSNYTSSVLPDVITNITVNDEYSTSSSNFTNDSNQTTVEFLKTTVTAPYTTTNYPTTSIDTTTTTPELPTRADSKFKVIFRNVYSVRNLTEVIVKN